MSSFAAARVTLPSLATVSKASSKLRSRADSFIRARDSSDQIIRLSNGAHREHDVSMRLLPVLIALAIAPVAGPSSAQLSGPKVDHHQHLLSPDLAPIMARGEESEFKAVALPPDMADLLRRRTAAWNDSAALAKLYSDQVVLAQYADQTLLLQDATTSGRGAVSGYLAKRVFARAYTITPFAYSQSGPVRQVGSVSARTAPRGEER